MEDRAELMEILAQSMDESHEKDLKAVINALQEIPDKGQD
jgi:hypothetical protein